MPSISSSSRPGAVVRLDGDDAVLADRRRRPRRSPRRARRRRPRSPPRGPSARGPRPRATAPRAGARPPARPRARSRAAARSGRRRRTGSGSRGGRSPASAASAVVVPSPATPSVASAAAFTSRAPWRSRTSQSSISPATVTPSFVIERAALADVEHDVAALRAERHLDGVGDGVDACQQRGARVGAVGELLGSHYVQVKVQPGHAGRWPCDRLRRASGGTGPGDVCPPGPSLWGSCYSKPLAHSISSLPLSVS